MVLKRLLLISCLLIAKALATAPMYENVVTISCSSPYGLLLNGTTLYAASSSGALSTFSTSTGALTKSSAINGPSRPTDLAFSGGNLWLSDAGSNNIYAFKSATLTTFNDPITPDLTLTPPSNSNPWGLTFDQAGNLYIVNNNYGNTIDVYNSGTLTTLLGTGGTSTQDPDAVLTANGYLNGIAFDGQGKLYTTDWGNENIYVFNSDNLGDGATPDQTLSGFNAPIAVAFDPQGLMYVTNVGQGSVDVYQKDGTMVSTLGTFGYPQSVVASSDGQFIYVADAGSNSIQKFRVKPTSMPTAMTQEMMTDGLSGDQASGMMAAMLSGTAGSGSTRASMLVGVGNKNMTAAMTIINSTINAPTTNVQVESVNTSTSSIVGDIASTVSDLGGGGNDVSVGGFTFTSSQKQRFQALSDQLPFMKFQSVHSMIEPINAPVPSNGPIFTATSAEQGKGTLKPLYMMNERYQVWVQPYGGLQKLDSYDHTTGLSIKSTGVAVGGGGRITPDIILGVIGGGAANFYSQDAKQGDGTIENFYTGLYGVYSKKEGGVHVDGTAIFAKSRYDTVRNITALNLKAKNSHDGWSASGKVRAGYKIKYGQSSSVDPFVSVGLNHSYQAGYKEFNAAPFNMNVSASKTDTATVEIGSKFERLFTVNEAVVKPLLIVSALREQPIKRPAAATLSFTDSGGSFTVPVSTQIKTYATATAGCAVMFKNNVTVSALVSGKIKKHEKAVSAVLKVSYNF